MWFVLSKCAVTADASILPVDGVMLLLTVYLNALLAMLNGRQTLREGVGAEVLTTVIRLPNVTATPTDQTVSEEEDQRQRGGNMVFRDYGNLSCTSSTLPVPYQDGVVKAEAGLQPDIHRPDT